MHVFHESTDGLVAGALSASWVEVGMRVQRSETGMRALAAGLKDGIKC